MKARKGEGLIEGSHSTSAARTNTEVSALAFGERYLRRSRPRSVVARKVLFLLWLVNVLHFAQFREIVENRIRALFHPWH